MNRVRLKEVLEELGMRPSKSMGQNYLVDENLARWIAAQANLKPEEHLLEIGPGLGALTDHLLPADGEPRPGGATLIEFDRTAAVFIEKSFGQKDGVTVLQQDAVQFPYRTLFSRGPTVLVSNLPYKGGGMMLMNAAEWPTPIVRMIVMLQMEVADRLTCGPGHDAYGGLTALMGHHWKCRIIKKVSPQVFWPEPAVESAILELVPRAFGEMPVCREETFQEIVRVGFSQRRKQLVKLLKGWREDVDWAELLGHLGLNRQARAEDLSVKSFCRLAAMADPPPAMNKPAQNLVTEIFDIVDEQDAVIGQAPRGEVHDQGLRHRAVHIFLHTERGEIFLQRRSPLKDKCPNLWDSSAAGHLDTGETYEAAATREIQEELGVELPLTEVGRIPPTDATGNEFVRLFVAEVGKKKHVDLRWPPSEIESGAWFRETRIAEWVGARPQDFAPGFLECWKVWVGKKDSSD